MSIKEFLRKYLYLPIWWLILGRPTKLKDFEKYDKELQKITDAYMADKKVFVRVNGKIHKIEKVDGKMTVIKDEK